MNFWRNGLVSASSIFVMIIALFMIGSTILLSAFMDGALADVQEKIDVNIYFNTDAEEKDILALRSSLENLPEVKEVEYVSRDRALENFRKRHKNNQTILEALDSLEANPLRAVLNIKAREPGQYDSIVSFVEGDVGLSASGLSIIDKVNYSDNKIVIDRLTRIISGVNKLGFVVSLALILISIFITFNTIRLVIFISRQEISVMQLVGADTKYVRGPFVVTGIMYGVIAALITAVLFYPIALWLKKTTFAFYGGVDILVYYLGNFWQIFAILLGSGVLLGGVASFLAVRRYLS